MALRIPVLPRTLLEAVVADLTASLDLAVRVPEGPDPALPAPHKFPPALQLPARVPEGPGPLLIAVIMLTPSLGTPIGVTLHGVRSDQVDQDDEPSDGQDRRE